MPTKIDIANLSVRFDVDGRVVTALDHINLAVEENEFICVMGPSGCGKTTLLNVIAGIVKATEGSVRISGKPVSGPGPDRAVVFQDDAVFPWMTVFFITHDLEEALFLGDRVILMSPRPGRIAHEYRPGFDSPRDMSFKNSDAFVKYARELREALHETERAAEKDAA